MGAEVFDEKEPVQIAAHHLALASHYALPSHLSSRGYQSSVIQTCGRPPSSRSPRNTAIPRSQVMPPTTPPKPAYIHTDGTAKYSHQTVERRDSNGLSIPGWRESILSVSTAGGRIEECHRPLSLQHQTYGIDIEKQSLRQSLSPSLPTSPRSDRGREQRDHTRDVEREVVYYSCHDEQDEEAEAEQHVPWILFYLAILSPAMTFLVALHTVLILLFTTFILTPWNILRHRQFTLSNCASTLLLGPLRYQFRLVYAPFPCTVSAPSSSLPPASSAPYALPTSSSSHHQPSHRRHHHHHSSSPPRSNHDHPQNPNPNLSSLILINFLSPVFAVALAVAAFVAASFWIFSGIMGDPKGDAADGTKDDDGKTAVLRVRRWWVTWLGKALR
ncbi:hypothetical protein MMC25_005987 [Agyrium rufum]|nr:hypothetical protein [Agyrium rufum]